MLYTAQHLSLACLEILVNLDKKQLPHDYVWSTTELSETPTLLPFENLNSVGSCRAVGDAWVRNGDRLAAQVPSLVIPEEFNILLNPNHAGYGKLLWSEPSPFRFDPRLFAEPSLAIERLRLDTSR